VAEEVVQEIHKTQELEKVEQVALEVEVKVKQDVALMALLARLNSEVVEEEEQVVLVVVIMVVLV
tara:strand:+ start:440 stop:634 length:195 start_codon:yes stop_codon:yes gene_type:complete